MKRGLIKIKITMSLYKSILVKIDKTKVNISHNDYSNRNLLLNHESITNRILSEIDNKTISYFNKYILNLTITKFELQYIMNKINIRVSRKYLFFHDNRNYIYGNNINNDNISCNYIIITTIHNNIKKRIFSLRINPYKIKFSLIIIMIFIIWFYIFLFIKNLYSQYGDKLGTMFIIPFLIKLVMGFLITSNLIYLFTTILLYFYGEKNIYYNKKKSMIRILFYILVPSILESDHKNILLFKFIQNNPRSSIILN